MSLGHKRFGSRLLVKLTCLMVLLPLALSSPKALTSDSQSVRIATFAWPQRTELNGTGAYFEILRRIFTAHNLTLNIQYRSIHDSLGALYREETDMMLVEWHPDILAADPKVKHKLILAPRFPLDTEQVVAVSKANQALSWQEILDTPSHHIAWIADYNYHYFFDLPEHPTTMVKSTAHGLTLVERGRIDSYLDDFSDVEIAFAEEQFSPANFYLEIVQERNLYPLFNHLSEERGLLKIYDQGMQKLLREGELKEIFESYSLSFERIRFPEEK